jgi:hypothetical protein
MLDGVTEEKLWTGHATASFERLPDAEHRIRTTEPLLHAGEGGIPQQASLIRLT